MKVPQTLGVVLTCCMGVTLASWVVIPLGSAAPPEPPDDGEARRVVNAADFARLGSPTGGIQEAIDALPSGGGIVNTPPGEYLLRQSIRVPAGVTLQGAGGSTVLRRTKQAESKLSAPADRGDSAVRVENAKLFREGDEVGVWDQDSVGWNVGHAVVKSVKGNELLLDRGLARIYDPAKGAVVTACFPAITANGASRVMIRDLVVDGQPPDTSKASSEVPLGFTFAAIHLVDATDSRVEGCWVTDWPSDGISMQRGGGNSVVRCRVHGCRGNGLHPGGGLRDSTFSENVVRANGGEGLYFCAGVRHVAVTNNVFASNKGNGIGALGDNGDKYNVVTNNVCEANGGNGIWLFDGDNNTVVNNICLNNSQSAPGKACGILLNQTADTIVSGNRCLDDQATKTQKHGILEFSSCRSNVIADNLCRGNAGAGLALEGKDSRQSGNLD